LKIPLREGRFLEDGDDQRAEKVIVVDSVLARRYWPTQSALGRQVLVNAGASTQFNARIVGVVGHVRRVGARDEGRPQIYLSYFQIPRERMYLAMRGRDPDGLIRELRTVVRALDADQPIAKVRRMEEMVADATAADRFTLILLGAFAALATVLACVGLYGVMAHSVTQRSREIGVRLALGSKRSQVIALILRQGLVPVILGVVAGAAGAFALSSTMSKLLFGVPPTDAMTYATAAALLVTVALIACVIPAVRASRTDPVMTLRSD
jgi:putative ABC transport system permease protein